jgi:serine/threonine-protein kinase
VTGSFTTILFTDLVGSTSLFDRRGDDAADALRREHFAGLRAAVAEHDGREVKSVGDGLMVAFSSAVAAVRCAISMQQSTAASGLGLRVGLDAGEPVPDGDDLYGRPVIVASRLCNAAQGGEILVSDVVRQIAAPRVAGEMEPAGTLQLKGIADQVAATRIRWRPSDDAPPMAEEPPRATTRVVIADDEVLLREGLSRLLTEAGFEVVGAAADATALLRLVDARRPDLVLTDIKMPPDHEEEGLVAAQEIRSRHPDIGVLVLSHYLESRYAMRLLQDLPDRSGYLLKDRVSDVAVLADALRRIAEGECVVDPTIVSRLVARRGQAGSLAELTDRERDVLGLMAEGHSNDGIAGNLHLSAKTVEGHIRQIFMKLGIGEAPESHRRVVAVLTFLRASRRS